MTRWLVTGAGRGIGLGMVRALLARGEEVIATARRPQGARELAASGARVLQLDVTDPASVAALAGELRGEPLDVLVGNAGVGVGRSAPGLIDFDELRRQFEVNAIGTLRVTDALLDNLRRGARRLVAHMSSKMGSIADNTSGNAYAYRASKAALNALTKSLAIDLAPEGFTCVVLHPGWVRTDMGGSAAPLSVEESVAGLLAVLESLGPERSGAFLDFSGAEVPW